MNPEDMGTTGLQHWVNGSADLFEFRLRRDRAELILTHRLGSFAAMIFVEKLCNDKCAAKKTGISSARKFSASRGPREIVG